MSIGLANLNRPAIGLNSEDRPVADSMLLLVVNSPNHEACTNYHIRTSEATTKLTRTAVSLRIIT